MIVIMDTSVSFVNRLDMNELNEQISERLKQERKRLKLTQEQVAGAGNVHRKAQGNYEGGTRAPDAVYLAGIAKHGFDIKYVVTGETEDSRLSPDETLLLQAYRGLDQTGKTAALGAVVGIGQAASGVTQNFHERVGQVAAGDIVNHEKKRK